MKNIILGSVLAVAAVTSLSANAVTICAGAEAKNGASVATGSFVKVAFTPKCSANVFLDGNDKSSTVYNVSSGSAKGKKIFAGSTVGGAVSPVAGADCPADGCTAALVTAKVDAAEGS
jgi:hypothetical protein